MNEIVLASAKEVELVGNLYDLVNDYFEAHTNYCYPNWQKGKYPITEDAREAWRAGTLFVLREEEKIVGAIIIDNSQHPAYKNIPWTVQVPESKVMVIHTLVVDPDYRGKGQGEKLVRFGIDFCKKSGAETIRLDTHYKNVPARRLYEKCGFRSFGCHKALADGVVQEFDVFEYEFRDF